MTRLEAATAKLAEHDARCVDCKAKAKGERATRCLVGFRLYVEKLGAERKDGELPAQGALALETAVRR